MAYDWSGVKLDGTETANEICEIVGCSLGAIYRKCIKEQACSYLKTDRSEGAKVGWVNRDREEEVRGLPRASYPTIILERPLEGIVRRYI